MKWFEDQPEKEFRERVFRHAEAELAALRPPSPRRVFILRWSAALGTAAFALLAIRFWRPMKMAPPIALDMDPSFLGNLALIQDLDLWQNLDLLESAPELDEDV